MDVRRFTLTGLVCACVLAGCLVLSGTPAMALTVHKYESQITEIPAEGPHGEAVPIHGPTGELNSTTVDSGDLFIADNNSQEVEKEPRGGFYVIDEFDASTREFIGQLPAPPAPITELVNGVAVGRATGKRQLFVGGRGGSLHPRVVAVYGESSANSWSFLGTWTGQPGKEFAPESVLNVAADNSNAIGDWASGDAYVAGCGTPAHPEHVVSVFKPEANGGETFVTQIEGTGPGKPFSCPIKITVNEANGDVLVLDYHETRDQNNNPHFEYTLDVFEPEPNVPSVYKLVSTLIPPSGGFIHSIAVDGGSGMGAGDIYVGESGNTAITTGEVADGRVYEFSGTGGLLDTITGNSTPAKRFEGVDSLAVDPASQRVFVGDRHQAVGSEPDHSAVDVFGRLQIIPDVVTEQVSNIKFESEPPGSWSARLNGTVNPVDAGNVTLCGFAWGPSRSSEQFAECTAKEIANGSSAVRVRGNLGRLEPDTTYFYRLQAGNANGVNEGEPSQDLEFTTPGPGLHGESVSKVSSSSATLEATVSPHLETSTYHFEYDTSAYDAGESPHGMMTPAVDEGLGSGAGEVEVSRHVQNLSADTVYHYRVAVSSEVEVSAGRFETLVFYGPDRTFTTRTVGGGRLPDHREWELVSPPDKHGALIAPVENGLISQAAASGDAFTFPADLPIELESQGYSEVAQALSSRGESGWSSVNINTPHNAPVGLSVGNGWEDRFFSSDLAETLVFPLGPFTPIESEIAGKRVSETFPEATEKTPYVRHNLPCRTTPTTCYEPLVTSAPGYEDVGAHVKNVPSELLDTVVFATATADASHVVVSSELALTATPPVFHEDVGKGAGALYEWSSARSAKERLELVSILPAGEGGEAATTAQIGSPNGTQIARHAISEDGSRVFFTARGAGGKEHLYMRDVEKSETIRVDAGIEGGRFQTASANGETVFFTGAPGDLYECKVAEVEEAGSRKLKCDVSDLTPEPGGLPLGTHEPTEVQNDVLGASEDGSYVYFVANGVLAGSGNRGDCAGSHAAPAGATCNLYVRHDDVTRLVATVSAEDCPDWGCSRGALDHMTSRVSPDGKWLAFMSNRSLTGYDNRDANPNPLNGGAHERDEEVFLYHAPPELGTEPGTLVCASCDPTGARPVGMEYAAGGPGSLVDGHEVWNRSQWLAANIPGWTAYRLVTAVYQPRYLSDEGRLFFNSSDALVSQDINGTEDVYEFEPAGVGDCTSGSARFGARSGGCVGLMSSGKSSHESAFLDASEGGGDVFFLTTERLLPQQDVDGALDVYDAHACPGEAQCVASTPAIPPACTTSDGCRAAPSPQPAIFGSPASATFSGAGNLTPVVPAGKPKSLTRAQKLARALGLCHKKKRHKQRVACERQARARFGPVKTSKKASAKRGVR